MTTKPRKNVTTTETATTKRPQIQRKSKQKDAVEKTSVALSINDPNHPARSKAAIGQSPSLRAVAASEKFNANIYGELDVKACLLEFNDRMDKIHKGDMKRVETILFAQAETLDLVFNSLARKASHQQYLAQYETYMKLALKAQNQCRNTLQTLSDIKNPPVIYAKQANFSSGHQQVNNGVPTHAGNSQFVQSKLSEVSNELLPDARASQEESGVNPTVEAVGKIHRAEVTSG